MSGLSVSSNVASSATRTTVTHVAGTRPLMVGNTFTVSGHRDSMYGLSVSSNVASSATQTTVHMLPVHDLWLLVIHLRYLVTLIGCMVYPFHQT